MDFLEIGKTLLQATEGIVNKVHEQTEPMFLKLQRMQEIYLNKNNALYSHSHIDQIKRHLQSVTYKFVLTDIHLEQLWALSLISRSNLWKALDDSHDRLEWNDNQLVIGYVFLESFLFQARSFIDIFFRYICLLMGDEKFGKMSSKKFFRFMTSNKKPFKNKRDRLHSYFKEKVFGEDQWGALLRSLRDKIAHQEHLRPSYEWSEKLLDKVHLDLPTIQGRTFDRLCQEIENGMFEMIRKTSSILFDLEWKSGPYRADLWTE
jgi:hypothetical protein